MYYAEELVEDVRVRNDIVDIISGYVRITRKGNSHFGLCPFHSEKTPSFSVSGPRQMYYCFGCGAGGNVFTFIMEYENFSFPEAVKHLATRVGISLPDVEYSEETRANEGKRAKLLEVNKEAARYFYHQLHSERGEKAYQYLERRGLTAATIKAFGLGYALKTSDDLILYLQSKGYHESLIREAGLATYSEKHGMNDLFWNRVIFPIQDLNHRVIGFGARVMGAGEPKYLNSPETMVFDKGKSMYGLNFARTARKKHLIICEGYTDVIALHQAGFTEGVASLGTAFTAGQAHLMRRYAEELILAYDNDTAGERAALRALDIIAESGLAGRVLDMRPSNDPDDFMKSQGAAEFEKRIKNAENGFIFALSVMERSFDQNDPGQKTRFHREIAAKLCELADDVERDNYLAAVCGKYGINPENMRSLIVSQAAKRGTVRGATRPHSGRHRVREVEDHVRKAEKALLIWLAEEPGLFPKIKGLLAVSDFSSPLYQEVWSRLIAGLESGNLKPAAIVSQFSEEEEQREVASVFNTPITFTSPNEREKAFNDILRAVKRSSYENMVATQEESGIGIEAIITAKKELDGLPRIELLCNEV
ncbi:MAG: DNA primase [Lachnospiraceae bacterium]|jgi:DNA primase|nr:DNA primase [Lachnospiraceae bacterium]